MTARIVQTTDLDTCFRLRHQVLVKEQPVPVSQEIDACDTDAVHLLVLQSDTLVGTARIVFDPGTASIGRGGAQPTARRLGLGAALITHAAGVATTEGVTTALFGTQLHALSFYEKLGFQTVGKPYLDAGIKHKDMTRDLT